MFNLFPNKHNDEDLPASSLLRGDTKFAAGKIAIFQYVAVGIFLFLVSGFWNLQVQNSEGYSEAAERNRIKSLPLLAPRGKILDRDGRVIVDNHSTFSLILSRENLKTEHLLWAARREIEKSGRSVPASEFGPYASRVEALAEGELRAA